MNYQELHRLRHLLHRPMKRIFYLAVMVKLLEVYHRVVVEAVVVELLEVYHRVVVEAVVVEAVVVEAVVELLQVYHRVVVEAVAEVLTRSKTLRATFYRPPPRRET